MTIEIITSIQFSSEISTIHILFIPLSLHLSPCRLNDSVILKYTMEMTRREKKTVAFHVTKAVEHLMKSQCSLFLFGVCVCCLTSLQFLATDFCWFHSKLTKSIHLYQTYTQIKYRMQRNHTKTESRKIEREKKENENKDKKESSHRVTEQTSI